MKEKNRILLYSVLFILISLFIVGIFYQKYYEENKELEINEEIPEIKEEFNSVTYNELRSYNNSNLYLDPDSLEIIRESNEITYIIGNYGKLYTKPIIDKYDDSDQYEENEIDRCGNYSVYTYNSDYSKLYIKNKLTNDTTDIFSVIEPIRYDDTGYGECRYFLMVDKNDNSKNDYYVYDSKDESITKFDETVIDVNPEKISINNAGDSINAPEGNLYLSVTTEDNKCGLVDYETNYIINPKYDELYVYNNSSMVAKLNNKFGIINSKDEILLNFEYDGIEIFDNYILVIKNNKIGILNKDFDIIVDYEINYDNAMEFKYSLCCAELNSYYAYEDDNLILQTYSSNDIYFEYGIPQEDFDKYVNYYIINKDGIVKKIDGFSISTEDKYILIASTNGIHAKYSFYDTNYNLKSEYVHEINHSELDYVIYGYLINKNYFSLGIYYPNNEEINDEEIYFDALNNKQVSKFDTEYNYFDNGYGYRIDDTEREIEIYKGDDLLSTTSNIFDITYVGDYMFIVKDLNDVYKIIKVAFNKES